VKNLKRRNHLEDESICGSKNHPSVISKLTEVTSEYCIRPHIRQLPIFSMRKLKKKRVLAKLSMSFSSEGFKQKEVKLYYYEIINSKFNILNIILGTFHKHH
jgi:hypothetical protein